MIKLISEEFCAPAKIVLAPGQGKNVRDVKVITRCFTPVARRIAYLKCAKNLNLWDETLLGVAEAVYAHVLVGESPSSSVLTRKTREAKAELVDRVRRKNVSLGDCQIPVLKGAEHREARHAGAEERNVLVRVREKEFHRQAIGRPQVEVEVCIELVFVVATRHHRRVVDTVA